MFQYNGKEYKVIIWDWLYTVFNPDTGELYQWVPSFFDNLDPVVTNYLVSFAKHPHLREQKIKNSILFSRLKKLVIDIDDKKLAFQKLAADEQINPADVLVIGDNVAHEGQAALTMHYDFVHVWDFAKTLGFTHE